MWIYMKVGSHQWCVGFLSGSLGTFNRVSWFDIEEEAAMRVHYLNGGN